MNGDDDSVLFRDAGGYMSDDQLDYNAVDRNDGTLNDEDMLMEAVRSANEMIASEGLGNMADIDFKQRLAAAERAFQQQASGAGSDTLEGWSSDAESEDLPLATQKNLAISKATSRRRSASARPVNYEEDAMDTDNPADFIPDSLVDDDEDSNYEGFDDDDLPTSSDDDEYHMMDIEASARRAAGFSRKGRGARGKKNRKRGRTMDPTYRIEVQRALGIANQYYVAHELTNAYSQFGEAIRLEPTCAPAWKTMALIREEEGNSKAARQLYTVAAHLTPTDAHLWERLYSMYLMAATETEEPAKAGDPASKAMFNDATKHALYCLGFIIRHNPQDKTALWRKLDMLKKVGDYKGMAAMYRTMLKNDPYNMEAIRQATLVYAKRRNDVDTPIKWFSEAFSFYNCQAVKSTEEAIAQISAGRGGRGKHARADDSGSESDSDYNSDSDGDRNGGFDGSESWAEYYRSNPESTVPMEEVGGYTYSDLNIIAELRILRQEYEAAISDVKRGARFIQGRGRAKHWEDMELKDEFDLEYPPIPESDGETHNALPIELRVRLGQCRFLLGQRDSAQAHFASLFAFGVPGYQDLFADVGETYMESGNYELAIQVYNLMCNCGEADEPSTWDKLAKCYREIHDFEMACEYANRVIEADENDVEMLIWLGDLYEDMGLLDKAMDTINKAEKAEERVRTAAEIAAAATEMSNSWTGADAAKLAEHGGATQLSPAVEIWEDRDQVVQIDTRKPSERTLRRRKDDNEQTQRHLHAMRNAEVAFKKLDLLKPQIDKDQDPNAVAEYCRSAARLFNDWNTIHAFYMTDRAKPFRNYRNHLLTSLENGTKSGGVDIQSSSAGQVAVRRELDTRRKRISKKQNHKIPHVIDKDEAGIPTTFRGILFDQ
ncbi:transcription factor TFIIIC subunit tfc4, partial [Coemansia sp. RSA 1694]